MKAAISNPHTSDEAKRHAAERLQELGELEPTHQELGSHQIAGYKATLTSSVKFHLHLATSRLTTGSQILTLRTRQNNTLVKSLRQRANSPRHSPSALTMSTPSTSSRDTKPLYTVSFWSLSLSPLFCISDRSALNRSQCLRGGQRACQGFLEGARRGCLKFSPTLLLAPVKSRNVSVPRSVQWKLLKRIPWIGCANPQGIEPEAGN